MVGKRVLRGKEFLFAKGVFVRFDSPQVKASGSEWNSALCIQVHHAIIIQPKVILGRETIHDRAPATFGWPDFIIVVVAPVLFS